MSRGVRELLYGKDCGPVYCVAFRINMKNPCFLLKPSNELVKKCKNAQAELSQKQ